MGIFTKELLKGLLALFQKKVTPKTFIFGGQLLS